MFRPICFLDRTGMCLTLSHTLSPSLRCHNRSLSHGNNPIPNCYKITEGTYFQEVKSAFGESSLLDDGSSTPKVSLISLIESTHNKTM